MKKDGGGKVVGRQKRMEIVQGNEDMKIIMQDEIMILYSLLHVCYKQEK
jgi:hypothetical protein